MSDTTISDTVPLPSDQDPALQDIAFTFPVFEMGAEATRDNIARGDVQTKEGVDYWMLEGDGAQSSVRIDRITPRGVLPVEVRLRIGPVFEGGVGDSLYVYEYNFMRTEGGWLRTAYRRTKDV